MSERAVLSVHTRPQTKQRLEALARATNRTKSSLANEALEQYVSHQEWLIGEIEKGVAAADAGELVDDKDVEAWFRSIGVAD
jgi:RHH-type transcriptional regulator, rel operon repressor / antitoxin RelB